MILGMLFLLATPTTGAAQERRFHFHFGGGPTFVLGDTGEAFETGWGPALGVTFDVNERVGLQFEYAYRWFGIPDEVDAAAGRLSANHQTHQLAFNVIGNLTPPDGVRAYAIGGGGFYNREVEITEYVGNGYVCNPWYYICGTYPIEAVLGSRGGWDFGINIGGGVGIPIADEAEFFIETRFHYVWGPEINPATQLPANTAGQPGPGKANGSYWPLTFGIRF
jgi:hypothetical protein